MRRLLLIALISLLLSGCAMLDDPLSGYLMTKTVVPYTYDLNNTPLPEKSGAGSIVRVREPITSAGIYTELNTNAIGDIAREHGLQKVYFADMENFTIFSVWRSNTLVIYGE